MRYPGYWLICLAVAIPVLTAAVMGWSAAGVEGMVGFAGRLSGVAGLACLLTAALVSVRMPGFDRPFGGLTRLWKWHHSLGLAAFVLLLVHPVLMALSRVPWSMVAVNEVLLPPMADWVMWTGWVGLLAMMIFLAPSFQFFGRPEYQRWKRIHFLAGLALVTGLVHTLPLTRTMSQPASLALWGSLGVAAVLVYCWRAVLARRVLRRRWQVAENRELAPGVVEIGLVPDGGSALRYQPGQFIYFTPHDESLAAGCNEEHPYTISSAPDDRWLRIAVKDLGDASGALQNLAVGTAVSVEGPYGDFFPAYTRARHQLWIGGGIGITPFVSAARAIGSGMPWGDTVLIYCASGPERAYFLAELLAAAQTGKGLRVYPHYFTEEGPLDRAFVLAACPHAADCEWFVCGPGVLVNLVRRIARDLGVPASHFHAIARDLGVPASRFHAEEFTFL